METARDIMTRSLITLHRRDSIKKAIALFIDHGISGAPVVEESTGKMVGLVSEYDLILAMHSLGAGLDVQDAMKTRILSVQETTPVAEIADIMLEHKIRRVPVVNDTGQPVGIISRREILRAFLETAPSSHPA
jgi:CBS domain-containing protein